MTHTTTTDESNRSTTSIATTIAKFMMIMMITMNLAVGGVAATHEDGHESDVGITTGEICQEFSTILDLFYTALISFAIIGGFALASVGYLIDAGTNKADTKWRGRRNNGLHLLAGGILLPIAVPLLAQAFGYSDCMQYISVL